MSAAQPPSVTSPPNPSALPESWIERLFLRFSAMYGSKFADLWRGCDKAEVKALWAEELGSYTPDEIRAGVDACKTRDWPPTLPEFLKLCRPPVDFERAFIEAVKQISLRDSGRDEWSHPAIYWAAVEIGSFDLRNSSWSALRQRWTATLQAQLAKGSWPQVPERAIALPAPCDIFPDELRLAQISREAARLTGLSSDNDPLGWAKRPITQGAWDQVLSGAEKSQVLREIVAKNIEDGIASESGILLQVWGGSKWIPTNKAA